MSKRVINGAELRKKSRPFVTCPQTGNTYQMHRPTLAMIINAGALPENFVRKTLEMLKGQAKEQRELTEAEAVDADRLASAMITAGMLHPRIVDEPTADDEIAYTDIPPADSLHLFAWQMGFLGNRSLETKDGETTVEAVENFPDGKQRGANAGTGADGEALRDEALATVGAE